MAIIASCPSCEARLKVPSTSVGKKLRCSRCKHVFVAEEPEAPEEVPRAIRKERAPEVYFMEGQTEDDTAFQDSPSERAPARKKKSSKKRKHAPASNPLATGPDLFDQGPPFYVRYWHYALGGLCAFLAVVLVILSLVKDAPKPFPQQKQQTQQPKPPE